MRVEPGLDAIIERPLCHRDDCLVWASCLPAIKDWKHRRQAGRSSPQISGAMPPPLRHSRERASMATA